jgi:hypothetical protein
LTGFARTFCEIFAENERYPYDPELVRRGPGTLVVDVLRGAATHNGMPIDLGGLTARLHGWLRARSAEHPTIGTQIERAALTAIYRIEPDKTIPDGYPLWRLDFDCRAEVVAAGRTYAHGARATSSLPQAV